MHNMCIIFSRICFALYINGDFTDKMNKKVKQQNTTHPTSVDVGCVTILQGRAHEWHSWGQEFDPLRLHHEKESPLGGSFFAVKMLE